MGNCDFRFLGSVIKRNVVGAILLFFEWNLVKIFQNECSKSWYNTYCQQQPSFDIWQNVQVIG